MKAIFHFLGQERPLLNIKVQYYTHYEEWNGRPSSVPLGGILHMQLESAALDTLLEERINTMNYELYPRGYPMDKGEIVFYDENEDVLKRWKFNDGILQFVKTRFEGIGETQMITSLEISAAIQEFGHLHLKSWNISHVEDKPYQSPVVGNETKTVLVTKVIGPKELKLNEEGTYKVTSYNQTPSEQEKQRIKWMLKIGDKETQLEQQGEEIKYTAKYSKLQGKEILLMPYLKKHTETVSIKTTIVKEVLVLYIGGASDKESYYGGPVSQIINLEVKKEFDKIINNEKLEIPHESIYLGYNEVRGDNDIQNNVISKITNKENTAIYIIGHSLGGWNGAHLSQILTDKGYNIDLLITLDPVGAGSAVTYISDIFWGAPKPKANYWIQISTYPKDYQADDLIADLGEQWRPKKGMQINDECNCNHGSAEYMFRKNLKNTNISASDMLLHHIKLFLSKK